MVSLGNVGGMHVALFLLVGGAILCLAGLALGYGRSSAAPRRNDHDRDGEK
jgi:hypothetical protein